MVIQIPMEPDDSYEEEFADAGINIRPHLYECLKQANKYFQVIAFTASDKTYADSILDYIDPERELI